MIETVLMGERHNYFEMEMRPQSFLLPLYMCNAVRVIVVVVKVSFNKYEMRDDIFGK